MMMFLVRPFSFVLPVGCAALLSLGCAGRTSSIPDASGAEAPAAPVAPAISASNPPTETTVPSSSSAPAHPAEGAPHEIAAPSADEARPGPAPALPSGTTVLHIGDSMAAALQHELKQQLKAHGIEVVNKTEEGTHLPLWGGKFSKVPSYVKTYEPDLVIVNLGGNDAMIKDPSDRVAPIERLVEHLGGTPCVWVAPSLWAGENGVLGMIREHSKPCRYFDTNVITPDLPRDKKDKIHPSMEGRKIWTAALVDWLARERAGSDEQPWILKPPSAAR